MKITYILFTINIIVFIIDWLFQSMFMFSPQLALWWKNFEAEFFYLNFFNAVFDLRIWEFFTYMFFHGNTMHIFFNMFALLMFGLEVEEYMGHLNFLFFYLFTGLFSGVLASIIQPYAYLLGASGAIFGLLFAFGKLFPERELLFFFIIPMKAKVAVFVLGAMELFFGVTDTMEGIAHFAHLGGILFGWIYFKYFYRRVQRFIVSHLWKWEVKFLG